MAKRKKPAVGWAKRLPRVAKSGPKPRTAEPPQAESYKHPTAESLLRPDVGTQAQFRKKKPPATYRYDSSLSPALDWDGQNSAREAGEALIAEIAAQTAALKAAVEAASSRLSEEQRQDVSATGKRQDVASTVASAIAAIEAAGQKLRALSKPFLNWSGKAERLSFDVPTLPLFVHERLSTKAIIETLKGHKREKTGNLFDLFADPGHSITDQVLKAYEYADKWTNRMILGDSLMGDLLKNMRSSQIFSVCGMPEIKITRVAGSREPVAGKNGRTGKTSSTGDGLPTTGYKYQVELLGLDVFDPVTMNVDHRPGGDVPAWLLDSDYNALCFHVTQAFFPRTGAWESLKKALRGAYDEAVWDHLAGTVSAPFDAGEHGQVAVKVIDDRGNELLVVKDLKEAKP